jgi:hypothetical protein
MTRCCIFCDFDIKKISLFNFYNFETSILSDCIYLTFITISINFRKKYLFGHGDLQLYEINPQNIKNIFKIFWVNFFVQNDPSHQRFDKNR